MLRLKRRKPRGKSFSFLQSRRELTGKKLRNVPEIPAEDLSHLLARVATRDRAAFRALYDVTAPKLFAACLRLLRDRREGEGALQEVFVKIRHRADRFVSGVSHPSVWLNAVPRNQAIDGLGVAGNSLGAFHGGAVAGRADATGAGAIMHLGPCV